MKKDSPKLVKAKYNGIKVSNTIRGLKVKSIFNHMKLQQQNKVSIIDNYFRENGFIHRRQMAYIWNLYWFFVLNDFRYEEE